MYNGLSAGLLRQALYTTTRLGIYTTLFETFSNPDGSPPGFFMKAALGMTAGATGAFVGTPAEVALIRMTSDGNLPVDQRRNYKSVFDALIRITREEGLTGKSIFLIICNSKKFVKSELTKLDRVLPRINIFDYFPLTLQPYGEELFQPWEELW